MRSLIVSVAVALLTFDAATLTVQGTVVDPDGSPVAGAMVYEGEPSLLVATTRESVFTDDDGHFSLELKSSEQPTRLSVRHRAYAPYTQIFSPAAVAQQALTITLTEGATVEGRVTLNGGPAPEATVNMQVAGQPGMNLAKNTDADGKFVIDGLPAGDLEFKVYAGMNPRRAGNATATVRAGETVAVDIPIEMGDAAIAGTITDGGETLANVNLSVKVVADSEVVERVHGTTDDGGAYRFDGLQAGTAHLAVSKQTGSELELYPRRSFELASGTTNRFDVDLSSGSTVTGTVVGSDVDTGGMAVLFSEEAPVSEINLQNPPVYMETYNRHGVAMTDVSDDGQISFKPVQPGAYQVAVFVGRTSTDFFENLVGASAVIIEDVDVPAGQPAHFELSVP